MLYQAGDTVVINDHSIPAINIQLEDVPGFVVMEDGTAHWFGVYFEVMFEDGGLWEVSQGADENEFEKITVTEYDHWADGQKMDQPNFERVIDNWTQFVAMYEAKLSRE